MADSRNAADMATEVHDIRFSDFTADLIRSVFDAVLAANLEQTETYLNLLETVSSDLTEYINQTEGEVTNEELIGFIESVPGLPEVLGGGDELTSGHLAAPMGDSPPPLALPPEVASATNASLGIASLTPAGAAVNILDNLMDKGPDVARDIIYARGGRVWTEPKKAVEVSKGKLLDAIAQKVASDKFSILQEMVKLGIVRLVIESGLIETRLKFKAMTHDTSTRKAKERDRARSNEKNRSRGRRSTANEAFRRARGRDKERTRAIHVETVKEKDVERTSTQATLFGRVVLNFKTDYVPISEA